MSDIVSLIEAAAALTTAVGGVIGFFAARFHLNPKIAAVAADLESAQSVIAAHEAQIKTVVAAAKVLAPQVDKVIAEKQGQIDTLTKQINDATAQVNAIKATL